MKSFAELLDAEHGFHDLNVGFCGFDGNNFSLAIEDHSGVEKTTDLANVPVVAQIRASGVKDISFLLDCTMPDVIYEVVEPEPGKLEINMGNGGIQIEAEGIDVQLCRQNPHSTR